MVDVPNRFDNRKSIWAISVQYQSDAKWVREQKGIIHFRLNSIAANLFIIRPLMHNPFHGLSSFFSLPPEISMSDLEKYSLICSDKESLTEELRESEVQPQRSSQFCSLDLD